MPKIITEFDLSNFLITDFTHSSFTPTSVHFWKTLSGINLTGEFEIEDGVISGTISKIVLNRSDNIFDEVQELILEIVGKGPYIEDLAAFQRSGSIGVQLLLSGDDDIYGYNKGFNGDDTFHASSLTAFYGGGGFNSLIFDKKRDALNLDLNRDGSIFKSIEAFGGTEYADDMRGTIGDDRLYGRAGNDLLVGRAGNDVLSGSSGHDRLIGSTGADVLTGGSGEDAFIFERFSDSTRSQTDRITDFNRSYDIIDLKAIDANTERSGNQTFTWIAAEKFHGKAGELRYFKSGEKAVIAADVDGDKDIDFQVYLDKAMTLTALDFIL